MDIVSSRFHQPGLAARLFLLLAFCFMGVTQANAAVSAGEWQSANDLSIAQGDRFYDRSLGAYYTYNTVTANNGESLSVDLRLVVLSSSHSVLNADGTNADGNPFFMVPAGSAEHVVRINFQRRRAAFGYTTQMQRLIEQDPDTDGDGVFDAVDSCLDTPQGEAVDADGCSDSQKDDDSDGVTNAADSCPNTPLGEAVDAAGCSESQKDDDNDSVNNVADQCPNTPAGEAVDVDGCSDSQKDDDSDGVTNAADSCPNTPLGEAVDAAGCSESQKDDDNDGIVNSEDACPSDSTNTCFTISGTVRSGGTPLANALVTVGIDTVPGATDANGTFSISAGDSADIGFDGLDEFFPVNAAIDGFATGFAKVRIQPGVFDYELILDLAPVSDIIGDDEDVTAGVVIDKEDEKVGELTIPAASFPAGVTAITGQITYLDPETDVDLAPGGDLLALPAGANPNDTPVPLETFGMMEFDLVDQDGNPVSDLAAPAEVCMKAGAGLAAGDTIPLWYYDDEAGLWIEEGEGTVESRDGQLLICGEVNHFSWWNYDQPINTHSCFKYHFIDGDTGASLREEFDWFAEGVTYSGSSPERLCDRDGDDPATPAPGETNIDSLTVKRTTDEAAPEQIRVTTTIGGNKYYLVDDGDGTYSLSTGVLTGAIFDNPIFNASCLNNTNVSDCLFLDYKEGSGANGILPLDVAGIDFAPIISGLDSNVGLWGNMDTGTTTDISATVTDPESLAVSVAWSAYCHGSEDNGSLDPTVQSDSSGVIFTSTFTAPASVNSFYSYCVLTLIATDAAGNTSTASQWVNIVDPEFSQIVSGTLYGPDALPMANHLISFPDLDEICVLDDVTTDSEGRYTIEIGADCFGGEAFYYGTFQIAFDYDGVNWIYNGYYDPSVCEFYAAESGSTSEICPRNIHLPTVWGPVSGNIDVALASWATVDIEVFLDSGYMNTQLATVSGQSTYGPVMVPLSTYGAFVSTWKDDGSWVGNEFQLLSIDGVTVDLGVSTGSALITVYDVDGDTLAGETVQVRSGLFGSTSVNGITGSNGEFLVTGLPLGTVSVNVSGLSSGFGTGFIHQAGQELLVDINSPATCSLEGTIFDLFGQPIQSSLSYWSSTGANFYADSAEDGTFVMSGVPAGDGSLHTDIFNTNGSSLGYANAFLRVDNCRSLDEHPRVIRVDLTQTFEYPDFGGLLLE